MAEEEFNDAERRQMVNRLKALVLTIERILPEALQLLDALNSGKQRKPKAEVDEFGEPTYRFKVKVRIPDDIKMTRKMRDYALSKGFNGSTIQPVWESFVGWYRQKGTKWMDWTAVWQKWIRTELERRAGRPGSSRDLEKL